MSISTVNRWIFFSKSLILYNEMLVASLFPRLENWTASSIGRLRPLRNRFHWKSSSSCLNNERAFIERRKGLHDNEQTFIRHLEHQFVFVVELLSKNLSQSRLRKEKNNWCQNVMTETFSNLAPRILTESPIRRFLETPTGQNLL